MKSTFQRFRHAGRVLLLTAVALTAGLAGCEEEKKTVLDIETPGTKIELKESKTDGSLELDIDNDK